MQNSASFRPRRPSVAQTLGVLVAVLVLVSAGCSRDETGSQDQASTTASTQAASATTSTSFDVPDTTTPPEPAAKTPTTDSVATAVITYEQVMVLGQNGDVVFDRPNHLALDADDNLYVTEFTGGRVFVFSPSGELINQFAGPGDGIGQLNGPTGIAVDADGDIYVGESGASRVQKFSPEGEPITTWGQFGVDPGEFGSAMGIGINDDLGRVYVADHVNSRIQVFDLDGELLFMFPGGGDFSQVGDAPGELFLPIGVDLAADGTVYVVDSGNARVQTFTPEGVFIGVFSTTPVVAPQVLSVQPDGSFWVSGPTDRVVAFLGPNGEFLATLVPPPNGFSLPHGTETTSDGTVWLADTGNNVVRAFRVTD